MDGVLLYVAIRVTIHIVYLINFTFSPGTLFKELVD
jgi:hypothetical protein